MFYAYFPQRESSPHKFEHISHLPRIEIKKQAFNDTFENLDLSLDAFSFFISSTFVSNTMSKTPENRWEIYAKF